MQRFGKGFFTKKKEVSVQVSQKGVSFRESGFLLSGELAAQVLERGGGG